MGTILVEKLLRSCPNIQTIYLLIRSKNGVTADDRLAHYFDNVIFNRMKKENSSYRSQVVSINGDISEAGVGLNNIDRNLLIEEINIVFHGAATVRFNEKLQKAIIINIRGTRDILALCIQMKNLKFITYVSTAYSHCEQTVLEEKFYKSPLKANDLLATAEYSSAELMDNLTSKLIKKYPNTYIFTKTVAEELIESCNDLPIAIFRPAIVLSTSKEPIPGWINNLYGPTWTTTARMMGLLRSLQLDTSLRTNIVPVDLCINALIAIPWRCSKQFELNCKSQQTYKISIYNYETNSQSNLTWRNFFDLTRDYIDTYPSAKTIGECFEFLTNSYTLHTINVILLHYVSALITDGVFKCIGKKSNLLKQYMMIDKAIKFANYFLNRHWNYKSENLIKLYESMTAEDQKIFFCDLRKFNWSQYLETYILGCRTYLFKEDVSTIAYARKRLFCIKFVTRLMSLGIFYSFVWFCIIIKKKLA